VKAAGITATGRPVEPLDLPDPRELRADEILIGLRAAGVGNWDEIVRNGHWPTGAEPPCALGVQGSGVVLAAGTDVSDRQNGPHVADSGGFRPGDEVLTHPLPLRDGGTWAERFIAPASLAARKPGNLAWPAAGVLPVPGLTAWQAVQAVAAGPHDTVIVHSAGGVTGGLIVQLAAQTGARVIATAGAASADRVRAFGAETVLDYAQAGWPARAHDILHPGATGAINAVPHGSSSLLPLVGDGGRLATITSDPPEPERGVTILAIIVQPDAAALGHLASLVAAGQLSLAVRAGYPLADAAAALQEVLRGTHGTALAVSA
jgi:NADPH:quinone reductase-like Zn-dependent oxidoreductase